MTFGGSTATKMCWTTPAFLIKSPAIRTSRSAAMEHFRLSGQRKKKMEERHGEAQFARARVSPRGRLLYGTDYLMR